MAKLPADIDGGSDNSGGSISDAAAIDLLQTFLKERVGDSMTRIIRPGSRYSGSLRPIRADSARNSLW